MDRWRGGGGGGRKEGALTLLPHSLSANTKVEGSYRGEEPFSVLGTLIQYSRTVAVYPL